jgi:hypothetical protein
MCLFWLCYVDRNAIKFELLNGTDMYKLDEVMNFCFLHKASLTISSPSSHLSYPIILLSGCCTCSAPSPCAGDTSLAQRFTTVSKVYGSYSLFLLYTLVPWNLSECNRENIQPKFISLEIDESYDLIS